MPDEKAVEIAPGKLSTQETNMTSITVLGRRWGSYFSVSILVDGVQVHRILGCGFGDYYIQAAFEWLDEQGITTREKHDHGGSEAPWRYCNDRGITFHSEAVDVSRKKDL